MNFSLISTPQPISSDNNIFPLCISRVFLKILSLTGLSSTSYSTLFKFVIEAPKCADIIVDKLDPELCNPTLILKRLQKLAILSDSSNPVHLTSIIQISIAPDVIKRDKFI